MGSLIELDIDQADHPKLADILDQDHGGTVTVLEFFIGISRLRGEPRRSDVVNIDLMVRAVQTTAENILEFAKKTQALLEVDRPEMEGNSKSSLVLDDLICEEDNTLPPKTAL